MGKKVNMNQEEQYNTNTEEEQDQNYNAEEENQIGENQSTSQEEEAFTSQEQQEEQEADDTEQSQEAEQNDKKSEAETEESEIERLRRENQEWQDKYLRLSAEYDNFRKRTMKEKSELMKSAGEDILASFLPIMDDFERAKDSIDNANDIDSVREGIELIYNKLKEFLKSKGITEIDAMGKDFNTDEHEAMTKAPANSEEEKGKVMDVLQKGYYLNNKVLRHARVVVGE